MDVFSCSPVHSVAFTLDFQCSDMFELIREIEKQVKAENSIIHVEAHIGAKYICTFKEEAVCRKLLMLGKINYRGKFYHVKPAYSNIVVVRVKNLPRSVRNEDVTSSLNAYGKVYHVIREKRKDRPDITTGHRIVMMELSEDLPRSLRISDYSVIIELC